VIRAFEMHGWIAVVLLIYSKLQISVLLLTLGILMTYIMFLIESNLALENGSGTGTGI
jgi:hypothetical protein